MLAAMLFWWRLSYVYYSVSDAKSLFKLQDWAARPNGKTLLSKLVCVRSTEEISHLRKCAGARPFANSIMENFASGLGPIIKIQLTQELKVDDHWQHRLLGDWVLKWTLNFGLKIFFSDDAHWPYLKRRRTTRGSQGGNASIKSYCWNFGQLAY